MNAHDTKILSPTRMNAPDRKTPDSFGEAHTNVGEGFTPSRKRAGVRLRHGYGVINKSRPYAIIFTDKI